MIYAVFAVRVDACISVATGGKGGQLPPQRALDLIQWGKGVGDEYTVKTESHLHGYFLKIQLQT